MRPLAHRSRAGLCTSLVLCSLMLSSCATNPVTGNTQLALFTQAEELALGLEADRELVQTFGEYLDDPELTAYVDDLGRRMAAQSERPDLPWTFRILDDETVNAFALPGGYVYITRGLLAHLGRESELAGVLGHEIGHVTARHAVHGLSRDLALTAALVVGLALLEEEDAEPYLSIGLQMLLLKFNRNQERQSDALATRYAAAVGLDPYGAVDALRVLSQVSAAQSDGWLPTWLSTHPDPDRRWARLAEEAGLSPPADRFALAADRDRLVSRLDGLVVGADPRNGMLDGTVYSHPRDGYRITFPAGWTVEREGQTVLATSPGEDAFLMLARDPTTSLRDAEDALVGDSDVNLGSGRTETHGGLPVRLREFDTELEGEDVRGTVALVPVGDGVVQLFGWSGADDWADRQRSLYGSVRSLRRLAENELPGGEPQRLRVVAIERPTTLRRLAAERAPGADLPALALLNDLDADEPLTAGRRVKLIAPR